MLLLPSTYIETNEILQDLKFITIDPHSTHIRLDRIITTIKDKCKYIFRMTHFGTRCGALFEIFDFINTRTNIETKTVESIEASTINDIRKDHICNSIPYNYTGIDGQKRDEFINRAVYNIHDLKGYVFNKMKLTDNRNLPINVEVFEDDFNLEYTTIIGNLSALITSASYAIPFRVNIIFDSKYGTNIQQLQLMLNDSDVQTIFKDELIAFTKALNIIYKSFKRVCDEEKRDVRLHIAIREFDSYIQVTDIEYHKNYRFHFNNSDHTRALMMSMSHLGSKWYDSEQFGDLVEINRITTIPSLFENEDRRIAFETGNIVDNYEVSYKDG